MIGKIKAGKKDVGAWFYRAVPSDINEGSFRNGMLVPDMIHSTASESFEEFVQGAWDGLQSEIAKYMSDKAGYTDFGTSPWTRKGSIFKSVWGDFTASLFPMGIVSLVDAGINLGYGFNTTMRMRKSADMYFTGPGEYVDADSFVGKAKGNATKQQTDANGNPVDVRKKAVPVVIDHRNGAVVAVTKEGEQTLADAKASGAEALKVVVVNDEGGDATFSKRPVSDENLNKWALINGAKISGNDTLVFPDGETMDAFVKDFGTTENLYEAKSAGEGAYTLSYMDEDRNITRLKVTTDQSLETREPDSKYSDVMSSEIPHKASAMDMASYIKSRERDTVLDKVRSGMGVGNGDARAVEMADALIVTSEATHIPSGTLADNIRVSVDASDVDQMSAILRAGTERGFSGKGLDDFAKSHLGKINGWTERKDGKYVIHLTRNATESTIVHEMGHVMRGLLGSDKERLAEFESIYGIKGSAWIGDVKSNSDGTFLLGGKAYKTFSDAQAVAVANEERFANDFVRYMKEGVAPTEGLRDVFSQMKTILKGLLGVYAQDLDPAVRKAFEDLYAQNDREKAGGVGTGTLMESVEESDNPVSFRENREALAKFDGQIQGHDTGKKYKANEFYTAYAHTPLVYRELGYGDLPFILFKSKVNQILAMPGEHAGTGTPHGDSVGIGTIREAVHGLSDPVAVFDSVDKDGNRRAGQFVVLVDVLDSKGKEVVGKRKLIAHSERMGRAVSYEHEGTENGVRASFP